MLNVVMDRLWESRHVDRPGSTEKNHWLRYRLLEAFRRLVIFLQSHNDSDGINSVAGSGNS